MAYVRPIRIEFAHCDPAGIVFYPRYFEMTNSVVETFFADVLGYPFARIVMEMGCGVPTVRLETDFRAPSRLGEVVDFTLVPVRLGRSSVTFRITAARDGAVRMTTTATLAWVGPDGRAAPWPEALATGLAAALEEGPAP